MNFKDYILNDIDEQKTLIDLLPKNTTIRKNKYNTSVNKMIFIYEENRIHVKDFIDYKYQKLFPVQVNKDTSAIDNELLQMRYVINLGNIKSSFFERLGLDKLLYGLMHYYDNSLSSVNLLLKDYVDILIKAGIKISPVNFRCNIYTYAYMDCFLNKYNTTKISEYQKLFWLCPKVIEYIIICLRILTSNNKKKLTKYVDSLYSSMLNKYNLKDYEDVKKKYMQLFVDRNIILDKNEYDIVNACVNRELDINNFIKGSNERNSYYEFFMINKIDLNNQDEVKKYSNIIKKLLSNLREYKDYLEISKLIEEFKKKYNNLEKSSYSDKELKKTIKEFNKYQISLLDCKYKSIDELFKRINKENLFKQEEIENKLYKLYNDDDNEYFNKIIKKEIKINSSVNDVLSLYDGYYYFLRKFIKSVMNIDDEGELDNMMDKINKMIYNYDKKIIDMIAIFVDNNIAQQLMNGYRFENLNINIESFTEDNIDIILDKGEKILIGEKVDNFNLSIDEVKFLIEVALMRKNQII